MPTDAIPELPYRAVEALVAAMAGVPSAQMDAFVSRLRYFQRLGFPAGKVGRGRKVAYRTDEVWQLAVAFELLQAGMTPHRAIRLVRTSWVAMRQAIGVAWVEAASPNRPMLVLFGRALDDMVGDAASLDDPVHDPVGIMSAKDLGSWMIEPRDRDLAQCVVIDVWRLAGNLRDGILRASEFGLDLPSLRRDFRDRAAADR